VAFALTQRRHSTAIRFRLSAWPAFLSAHSRSRASTKTGVRFNKAFSKENSMKAWQVHQYGSPEEMTLDEVRKPSPGEGEVLIRNHAAGLNFFDILQAQGKYQAKPSFPFTIGAEVAGTVEAAGPGVDHFSPGDRVLCLTLGGGGYAEYTAGKAKKTFPIPEGMGFEEAAAFPVVYQTSFFAVENRARLRQNEWLLVHAGASGVGMAAIQIGKAFGARIIATAGSEEKLNFCRELGADHAINYRDETWVDQVKQITGKGADVIYDPVGGDVFDLSTRCIAPDGRLLVVGFASGRIPSVAANRVLLKNIFVVGVFWGRHADENRGYLSETHEALTKLYTEGKINPVVTAKSPLGEAPAALRALADRKVAGKAVLTMP